MRNIRIGDYLVEQGLITQEQLEKVLEAQREAQGTKRFGDVIVELGFLSETKFTQALAGKLKVAAGTSFCFWLFITFQMMMLLSMPPDAILVPSGDQAHV